MVGEDDIDFVHEIATNTIRGWFVFGKILLLV